MSLLSTIQAVLEDAEEKQLKDKAIKDWLRKLEAAAYEVDDILDECAIEASRFELKGQYFNKVCTPFFTCFSPESILFRHRIGVRITRARERLDGIARERMNFHLLEVSKERRLDVMERRQTGSILTQTQVYGRDEDKEKVVQCLVEGVTNYSGLSVYPVVGIGGLGKTTIAQLVFNDERVRKHFDLRMWVCVSEEFDVRRLIKATIESASGVACPALDLDPLQRRLQEILNGKRYLLVLDDVWNEDQEKWDVLKSVLACGSKGTSILVTTRLKRVALMMGTLPAHDLLGLTENNCWSLFKERAFAHGAEEEPSLVAIGKEIVRKCAGVPLAVKALGSLMCYRNGENEWRYVKESEIWNLPQDESSILPALRLSYLNLPLHLQKCFAYTAVFPKDFDFQMEDIVHLWMANGLIPASQKLEQEDIGTEICSELYWRSFFQDVQKDNLGNIKRFKMHDLIHDLAQSVMADECYIAEVESNTNFSRGIHHISLHTYPRQSFTVPKALYKVESLRTLLLQPTLSSSISRHLISESSFDVSIWKLHTLRALGLRRTSILRLPSSIDRMKHLRYLDLSATFIRKLPDSMCSMLSLQTLKLANCVALQRLPKQMWKLKSLRHLYLNGCCSLSCMPPWIGQIACLNTLSLFIVGKSPGCSLSELQGLDLRGNLKIMHLDKVDNVQDAKEANLAKKQHLRGLFLSWGNDVKSELHKGVEKVLEALEPHSNLESLEIEKYQGTYFPQWMSNPVLQNVNYMRLVDCNNILQLPPLGQLHSLRHLQVTGMNRLLYIDCEIHGNQMVTGFPLLETLILSDLPSLESFSEVEGKVLLPCLSTLGTLNCPKLTTLPELPSLVDLRVRASNKRLLCSLSNMKSLKFLHVTDDAEMTHFPNWEPQNLTSLSNLTIERFANLKALNQELGSLSSLISLDVRECHQFEFFSEEGLQGLKSLQHLSIFDCHKFNSLSEGLQHLTALEKLVLDGCPNLVTLPDGIRHLHCLQHLTLSGQPTAIAGSCPKNPTGFYNLTTLKVGNGAAGGESFQSADCPKLAVLPETLQHVPILKTLIISCYPHLVSLPDWFGVLTSLESLQLFNCPKLASLPSSIQELGKLQNLDIQECPSLIKRCSKETGDDWPKIAHVPNVFMHALPHSEGSSNNHASN